MEKRMEFEIIGESPLLTRNPEAMTTNQNDGKAARKDENKVPPPDVEAKAGLYIVGGKFCFPTIGLRNGFVKAAAGWKQPWNKKQSMKWVCAHIVAEPEFAQILTVDGKPHKDYVIDQRRVMLKGKTGIVRARPKFERWSMKFTFVYDDSILLGKTEQILRDLLITIINDAGKRFGIGDYRPEKTGWFGRYTVREK